MDLAHVHPIGLLLGAEEDWPHAFEAILRREYAGARILLCEDNPINQDVALALLQDGDIIEIDADVGTLNVKLSDAELEKRKTKWQPRATNHTSGALWKYAQQVGPAVDGAVTHPGGAHEKQCYADI